jgi:hypothetical protein
MPHRNKSVLVQMLGLSESQVRVIAPMSAAVSDQGGIPS